MKWNEKNYWSQEYHYRFCWVSAMNIEHVHTFFILHHTIDRCEVQTIAVDVMWSQNNNFKWYNSWESDVIEMSDIFDWKFVDLNFLNVYHKRNTEFLNNDKEKCTV